MFKGIKDAWKESRAKIFYNQINETFSLLLQANPQLIIEFISYASVGHENIQSRLYKVSAKGRKELGKRMQGEARSKFDFDAGKGYAEWLLGAQLELDDLPGRHARRGREILSEFFAGISADELSPNDFYKLLETSRQRTADQDLAPRTFAEFQKDGKGTPEELLSILEGGSQPDLPDSSKPSSKREIKKALKEFEEFSKKYKE